MSLRFSGWLQRGYHLAGWPCMAAGGWRKTIAVIPVGWMGKGARRVLLSSAGREGEDLGIRGRPIRKRFLSYIGCSCSSCLPWSLGFPTHEMIS